MKTFPGYPCVGIAVMVLVIVSVLFTGCTTFSRQGAPVPAAPSVATSTPAPVRTPAPAGTEVSESLPYGVTLSVPADWTREDVLTSGMRDYGTTTLNIANFYSPDTIPGNPESYIALSVDYDQNPGADFEKYFNSATLAVGAAYNAPQLTGARSYTITISGYKSYELDFEDSRVKGTYIFTSTENGMYIFVFKVPNNPTAVRAFQEANVAIYKSIRIIPPPPESVQHR
jgi:hypothetical protein